MKQVIFAATIAGALFFGPQVNAQARIGHRQMQQHERIVQGKRSGELTRHESRHLNMQQHMIRRDKRMAMADGHISHRERQIINREQNRANKGIYRMKHNNRYR